jgi:hypothetical protein
MGATLTTVNTITKEIYTGSIQDQLNEEAIGFKRIERTSDGVTQEVGGKYVTFPIRVRRNQGIGYRNELEALPAAGQQGWASVRVGLKYGYGRLQLSGQVIKLADKNFQAFSSAMELEMTGLKEDIQKDTNRVFYGTTLGTMATITADAANQITVANAQYLEVGQQIDIVSIAGTVRAANRSLTAVNQTTGVCTYDGADASASVVATDIVVRTGNYGREVTGLASHVTSTGILFNVDPAVEPTWAATVNANAGVARPLSEGLMITLTDNVRQKGGKVSLILTNLGVRRAYFNLLSQQRRYPSTTDFAGGFTGLAFNNGREIPVIDDPDAPPNTMYFLDEDKFKIYQEADWDWMQLDGSIWQRVVGFDAYEAVLEKYWELGSRQRNAQAVLQDITEG